MSKDIEFETINDSIERSKWIKENHIRIAKRLRFETWLINSLKTRHDLTRDEVTNIYLKTNEYGNYVHASTVLRYDGWCAALREMMND